MAMRQVKLISARAASDNQEAERSIRLINGSLSEEQNTRECMSACETLA